VVAAGNEGRPINHLQFPSYPAAYAGFRGFECLLAVGASNKQNSLASFSNYGDKVEIAAPGEDIFSTYYSAFTTRAGTFLSGTSM
jgi:subtilisin family serine protease